MNFKRFSVLTVATALVLSAMPVAPAMAAVINIQANDEGLLAQNGGTAGTNHLVGNCGLSDCNVGEFRDWFTFQIGDLSGQTVNAITFNANTDTVAAKQGHGVTVQFTSTPSLAFDDLGNGTIFGSMTFTDSDAFDDVSVLLNDDAITAIGSGDTTFGISGRVIGSIFGPQALDSMIFGGSAGSFAGITIYTGDDHPTISGGLPGSVPEPSQWALMVLGFGSIGAMLRRRSVAVTA